MNTFGESVEALLPLLRCPACHSRETLEIKSGPAKAHISIQLCDKHLLCRDCNIQYPITEDYIPIMWDADLQRIYADINTSSTEAFSTIDANVAIYDNISDDYNLFSRRNPQIAKRLRHAVGRLLDLRRSGLDSSACKNERTRLHHLDFGCGPGHVVGWLKEFGFLQIGIDVSLKNLRNARKYTGCLVVCGNACNMPFADESIDIITESSVLHHIFDWKSALAESIRICRKLGGIVIDSEPGRDQMAWSPLAVMVFNARFPVYKALSYFMRGKYIFRNTEQAKLNLQAEVHHQPGTGFPLDEIEALFTKAGFSVDIVLSPTPELTSKCSPGWKSIVLNILSARNPWNPKYGSFTAIASRNGTNG